MTILEGIPGLVSYVLLKLILYSFWSYVGLRWFDPQQSYPMAGALSRGVGRLVLGWATGIVVGPLVLAAAARHQAALFYFTILVAVRWFEWGVIQHSIPTSQSGTNVFLTGGSPRGRLWRAMGILVSYLADAPFLINGGGFPQGRLFC